MDFGTCTAGLPQAADGDEEEPRFIFLIFRILPGRHQS